MQPCRLPCNLLYNSCDNRNGNNLLPDMLLLIILLKMMTNVPTLLELVNGRMRTRATMANTQEANVQDQTTEGAVFAKVNYFSLKEM